MSLSLSYQQMPPFLLAPLMAGAIRAWEASLIWDHWLMLGEPEIFRLPHPSLEGAAIRMWLLELEAEPETRTH